MEYYKDPRLENTKGIRHGFFGRKGGVSETLYESLNCGLGSDDEKQKVIKNKELVREALVAKTLNTCHQIHSDIALYCDEKGFEQRPEADALVTDVPGVAIGVLTADCTPVLFYAQKVGGAPVVGAAHAGWRGAFKGVLETTIKQMEKRGAVPETMIAAVGPCIAQKSYEVGVEFFERFMEQCPSNEHFFSEGQKPNFFQFDLPGYCARRLSNAGIKKITLSDIDTYSNESQYFSYRRATHKRKSDYGRQISVISIS